jgi:hypothetical protein
MSAAKLHKHLKWEVKDPQAFSIPRKQFEEIRTDLNTSIPETEAEETDYEPFRASKELYQWIKVRCRGTPNQKHNSAAMFVMQLSTYTRDRVKKAPQIYIHG